jgi:dipeptidyl aminopeptidase/acylaminoacyl peptidase
MKTARREAIRELVSRAFAHARPHAPRVSPDGRRIAWLEERGGTDSVVIRRLSGGPIQQLTGTVEPVTDLAWSPDGRSIAYLTGTSLRIARLRGGDTLVVEHAAGLSQPRWSPDGERIAVISRARGWGQIVLLPAAGTALTQLPAAITPSGVDVITYDWHPSGDEVVWEAVRNEENGNLVQLTISRTSGDKSERVVAGADCWATGGRWMPNGDGLIAADDRGGFFHVVHISTTGVRREIDPVDADDVLASNAPDEIPVPSPDGSLVAFLRYEPGGCSIQVRQIADGVDPIGRRLDAFPGNWSALSWLPDSSALVATGQSEAEPEDIWLLPLRSAARRITDSAPLVLPASPAAPIVVSLTARDGLPLKGLLFLPRGASASARVPTMVNGHGGPTWQFLRSWDPLVRSIVEAGYAYLTIDFRGSTGYGRDFRYALHDEWGHGDVHDLVDGARWAAEQPWSDSRFGVIGGSYGGYLTLCALVDEPALWSVGIDRYGDSDLALSYRLGDRPGRLDVERQMGRPDEPSKAPLYRRASPIFETEKIQAPLLMLHGRKDKRVVPRMTEIMARQLEIESKFHEVVWFDDEAHGWERRENQRKAAEKTLDFILAHLPPTVKS